MPKIKEGDFQKSINQAIDADRHVKYLEEVLKKYDSYKKTFEEIFTSGNPEKQIYKFKVTYLRKKLVWRDIEITGEQTFLDLTEKIIDSMGWLNDHMHGFDIPGTEREPDPLMTGSSKSFFAPEWENDPHPFYKTDDIRICDINYDKLPKLDFMFDYGAGHAFHVKFKSSRTVNKKEKKRDFPKVVDRRGVSPEQYPDYEQLC